MNHSKLPHPPGWAVRLLGWLHPADTLEEVEGDLEELYAYWVEQSGKRKANARYLVTVLSVLPPFVRQRKPKHSYLRASFLHPDMIRNYFVITLRTLSRNKLYTSLNMAGLTFGITCFLLIGLYLFDELTFDQQHSNANRIYRVVEHKNVKGEQSIIAAASYKLAEESRKMIPEVGATTKFQRIGRANLIDPENPVPFQETVTVADENFLQIFDFPLIVGDKKTALQEPNSIIINEQLAIRLFNKTEVVGKTLEFNFMDTPLKITGILKNHPSNSSFNFNSIVSEASFRNAEYFKQTMASDWSSNDFAVYVLVKPNTNSQAISSKITKLIQANVKPEAGTTMYYSLQALPDIYLNSENIIDGGRNSNVEAIVQGNPIYINIFTFIAFFVVVIAGINYMNLSTAKASTRTKEIGIRKSIGALRGNLVYQFLFEAILVTSLSSILAIVFINLLLPSFNEFTGKQLSLGFGTHYQIWLMAIGATVVIGLLSGSYPAFLLSGFKPVLLLKGIKINSSSSLSLRKCLVVFSLPLRLCSSSVPLYCTGKYVL